MRTFLAALALALLPSSGLADDFVADAFGLYPAGNPAGERALWSGQTELVGGNGNGSQSIAPQEPETILFFLGPKSLVAGKDTGHAVAIAIDRNGNLAEDNTAMRFVLNAEPSTTLTQHGIAGHQFLASTRTGLFFAGAATPGRQSGRAEFTVVTDLTSVMPSLKQPDETPLLPERFHDLVTANLTDDFGNTVEDGIGLQILITHQDTGTTVLPAIVRDGHASARLLTRDIEGPGTAIAYLGASASASVPLDIAKLQPAAPVNLVAELLPEIGSTRVTFGPFLTDAGFMLSDGAQVSISLSTAQSSQFSAFGWVRDGLLDATFPVDETGYPFTVTIRSSLGESRHTIVAPNSITEPDFEVIE